jgi:hypothetical protein
MISVVLNKHTLTPNGYDLDIHNSEYMFGNRFPSYRLFYFASCARFWSGNVDIYSFLQVKVAGFEDRNEYVTQ